MKRILVIAAVAAFTLTGGAVAASQITGKQIKNGTITGKDVKNRSLTRKDFKGSVRGAPGPAGAQGPAGPAGAQGPAGPVALGGIVRVESTTTVAAGDVDSATATCPAGHGLISGGFSFISNEGESFFEDDFGSRNSWSVGGDNLDDTTNTAELTAIAYCAPSGKAVAAGVRSSRAKSRAKVLDKAAALVAAQRAAHKR